MDPASTSVVAIGFAASIVTLSGLIVESWQNLHDLGDKLKEATKDTQALVEKVDTLERLLGALGTTASGADVADAVKELWTDKYRQMHNDFREFKALVDELDGKLKSKSKSSVSLRALIRLVFTQKRVARYNECLASHLQLVGAIQNQIAYDRGLIVSRVIGENSLSLQKLSQDAVRRHESAERATTGFQRRLTENFDAIQVISSDVSSLQTKTENSLSRIQATGNQIQSVTEAIRTELTDFRRGRPPDHYGSKRRIIESLASIERGQRRQSRAYQAFQITLKDIQSKTDQLIKIGAVERKLLAEPPSSRHHANERSRTAIERTMFFEYMSWNLPIGKLHIQITDDRPFLYKRKLNKRADQKRTQNWGLRITFQAPIWLSSAILQLSYTFRSQSGLTNWNRNFSFRMQNYNPDPLLLQLIQNSDLLGLGQFFLDGKGHANDYLPSGEPLLYYAIQEAFNQEYVVEDYQISQDERCIRLVEFLVNQGADVNASTVGEYSQSCQQLVGSRELHRHPQDKSRLGPCRAFKWKILSLLLPDANELDQSILSRALRSGCGNDMVEEVASNAPWLWEYFPSGLHPEICWSLAIMSLEDKRFRVCIPSILSFWQRGNEAASIDAIKGELQRLWHYYPQARNIFLCWAIQNGSIKTIEYVLSDFADLNFYESSGFRSCLGIVARYKRFDFRDEFFLQLEAKARADRDSHIFRETCAVATIPWSSSWQIVQDQSDKFILVLEWLVVRGFHTYSHPPYSRDIYLGPEVFSAVAANSPKALHCLLKHTPSLTHREFGHVALTLAVSYGSVEMVKSLLESDLPVVENVSDFKDAVKISSDCVQEEHPRVLGFIILDGISGYQYWTSSGTEGIYVCKRNLWKADFSFRNLQVELHADQTINGLLVEALKGRFDYQDAAPQPLSQWDRVDDAEDSSQPQSQLDKFLLHIFSDTVLGRVAHGMLNRLELLECSAFRGMRESRYFLGRSYWRIRFILWRYRPWKRFLLWKYRTRNLFLPTCAYVFCIAVVTAHEILNWARSIRAPPKSLIFGVLVAVLVHQMHGTGQVKD